MPIAIGLEHVFVFGRFGQVFPFPRTQIAAFTHAWRVLCSPERMLRIGELEDRRTGESSWEMRMRKRKCCMETEENDYMT